MHIKTKLALIAVIVVAVLPTATSAYACDRTHNDTGGVAAASFSMHHHYGLLHASATYLNVTTDQLKAKLASGQSLVQIADATPGKSGSGLVSYLMGLVNTKLDHLVAEGKLTSAQESAILARVRDKLNQIVNFHR